MPILPQAERTPLGIYIHIPFCRSKCNYCDFYSIPCPEQEMMDNYLQTLCAHIRETGAFAPDYVVDTVYFGGGTPSLFGAPALSAVLTTIRESFRVSPKAEITFEANPDSVTKKLLRRLKSEGFNRVSLGIQSDNDEILEQLGRPHTYQQAVDAVKLIRRCGFKNLTIDMMYGLPGQTLEDWEKSLRHVLTLKPDHISCYALTLEEGTPLYEMQHELVLADDDQQAGMYLRAVDVLEKAGFIHYEVSNFARKGMISRHNWKYWMGQEYLGFGPNASSDFGGKRFTIVRSLDRYIRGILNDGSVMREVEEISSRERAAEYLMTRLRTNAGIEKTEYEEKFMLPFAPLENVLSSPVYAPLAEKVNGRWRLTAQGLFVSHSIIADLQLIQEKSFASRDRI